MKPKILKPQVSKPFLLTPLAALIIAAVVLFLILPFFIYSSSQNQSDLKAFTITHTEAVTIAKDAHFTGCTTYGLTDYPHGFGSPPYTSITFNCSPTPYKLDNNQLADLLKNHGYKLSFPESEDWISSSSSCCTIYSVSTDRSGLHINIQPSIQNKSQ